MRDGLGSCSVIGIDVKYGLEILHRFGKRVKAKSQKGFGATFVEVTGKKVVGQLSLAHPPPLILHRVKGI